MRSTYHSNATTKLTRHALLRMQQRSIPAKVVELLLDFAEPSPTAGGCFLLRFTKETFAEARLVLGRSGKLLDRYRSAYLIVVSDDTVVTAARLH